jgi:hypothetical protein
MLGSDRAPSRRILPKAEVGSILVVIGHVVLQQSAQMVLIEHDDVIQQVLSKGSHHAFHGAVLPWTSKGDLLGLDAHGFHESFEGRESRFAIKDQILWDLVEREGFSQLLLDPFRRRMSGYVEMGDLPVPMPEDDQDKELLKGGGGNSQEVHGGNDIPMIDQKGSPVLTLGLGGAPLGHQPLHGALREPEPEFQ